VILLDANLLLYAYDASSSLHGEAKRWLEEIFSSPAPVALAWPTLLAFLRIGTHPSVFERPLEIDAATRIVESWLALPQVSLVHPTERHWPILQNLLLRGRCRGALVPDAHLAALAIEHGATLCTTDRDFTRFEGLRAIDPLQE
jgi:uncharacterized protein